MPKIVSKAKASQEWKPLPAGSYDMTINKVTVAPNKQGNDSIRVDMVVADGPHAGKKATTFYVILPQSMFRIRDLFYAVNAPFEEVELEELDDEGKKMLEYTYDPDDLIGKTLRYASVTVGEYDGKPNNRFSGETAIEGAEEAEPEPPPPPPDTAAKSAARTTQPASKPAPAAAAKTAPATSARRPVTRSVR